MYNVHQFLLVSCYMHAHTVVGR